MSETCVAGYALIGSSHWKPLTARTADPSPLPNPSPLQTVELSTQVGNNSLLAFIPASQLSPAFLAPCRNCTGSVGIYFCQTRNSNPDVHRSSIDWSKL
jgi:hypothetical protein